MEIEEIEIIQKELDNEAISIQDIDNRSLWFLSRRLILLPHLILLLFSLYDKLSRLEEEDEELASLTKDDLTRTTTTSTNTTVTQGGILTGSLGSRLPGNH